MLKMVWIRITIHRKLGIMFNDDGSGSGKGEAKLHVLLGGGGICMET